jgi:hypothetical protein
MLISKADHVEVYQSSAELNPQVGNMTSNADHVREVLSELSQAGPAILGSWSVEEIVCSQ